MPQPSSILLGIPPFEEGVRRQVIEFHHEGTDFNASQGADRTQIQQRPGYPQQRSDDARNIQMTECLRQVVQQLCTRRFPTSIPS